LHYDCQGLSLIFMATKFHQKIVTRLLDRLKTGGLNAALEYGLAVCGGNPHVTNAVLSSSPEPLKTMLNAGFAVRASKRQSANENIRSAYAAQHQIQKQIAQAYETNLLSARSIGQATVFVAGLTMAERDLSGATKKEVADAVAMRRDCLRSTKVKEALGCSDAELKRWSEDGRLPVMFRRRMPSSAGITLDVRHWSLHVIENAQANLDRWREEDSVAKVQKRRSR
jgi:hypothetical protein